MERRFTVGAAVCAVLLGAATSAPAQVAYYAPPKLLTQGKSETPIAGAGTVVIQVLVKKDGTFTVQRIIRSSNHGDEAAALEIAKNSTYQSATRGDTKLTAFFDFTLKFTGAKSAQSAMQDDGAPTAGDSARYYRMIAAGNYSGAQSGLKTYIAQHPDDASAQLDLAIADAYLNEFEDSAAAFDKAGTIPANYKALSAKAYSEASVSSIKSGAQADAVRYAEKAVGFAPGVYTYNTLGFANLSAGDAPSAVTALEKARSLAQADSSIKAADRAEIDANLVAAYLAIGKPDLAKQVGAEADQLRPGNMSVQNAFANYYVKQAVAAATAGKQDEAAVAYDAAASSAPSLAVALYARSAMGYLSEKPTPDNGKAKVEADKALALDPTDARANYAAGVALANTDRGSRAALDYLNKADASAKKANDAALATQIESIIKQLGGSATTSNGGGGTGSSGSKY